MTMTARESSHAIIWLLPATLLALSGALGATAVFAQSEPGPAMTASDTLLHVPHADYRRDWAFLGSFSVLADNPEAGAKEFHVVYTKRENLDAYRKAGKFPDGAVLVKDVFATKTEPFTTGTASYADALVGRFVMVKDATNRFAGTSPLWGDGWGWAFYQGTETRKAVTTDYRQDCLSCHEPARDQDFTYVQGYPILRN